MKKKEKKKVLSRLNLPVLELGEVLLSGEFYQLNREVCDLSESAL